MKEEEMEFDIQRRTFLVPVDARIYLLAAARVIADLTIASGKEKDVIFKMAKLGEEVGIKEIKAPKVSVHLKRLVEKNLLVRIDRGRYKFYHPLFREYLASLSYTLP